MKKLLIVAFLSLFVAGCSSTPKPPAGYEYDTTQDHDGEEYGGFE